MPANTTAGPEIEEAKRIATKLPPMKDLSAENITEIVHTVNSMTPSPRLKFLMENLVNTLHDFARTTNLTTEEWTTALEFLTRVGQGCTDLRHEFILLSDILGLSVVVDSMNHPKPANATEGTVMGPFHAHDACHVDLGSKISTDEAGTPCLVVITIKDTSGNPIVGVEVDVWETDSNGFYDVQYPGRTKPDGRAIITSDSNGEAYFKAILPVPYPIPHDGPVGELLKLLNRHPYRPSHMHFMFKKDGYDELITTLYLRNDPFESSDAVFGVKSSLLIDLKTATKIEAEKYEAREGDAVISYDFVLATVEEINALKSPAGIH